MPVADWVKTVSAVPSPQFTSILYGPDALDSVKLPSGSLELCPTVAL